MGSIKSITVKGFKSIRDLDRFEFRPLNVIVGANGSGKSNLLQIFRLLPAMVRRRLQTFIAENGGADSFPYNGLKNTPRIDIGLEFLCGSSSPGRTGRYEFSLLPTLDERFLIEEAWGSGGIPGSPGQPSVESRLSDLRVGKPVDAMGRLAYDSISGWMVYHFQDAGATAPMRRSSAVEDCERLGSDGGNIASFLSDLRRRSRASGRTEDVRGKAAYRRILEAVRLVMPFLEDFRLDETQYGETRRVRLSWRQAGSDHPMQAYQLSDGSLRFICLATALLQPDPPSTIIIDEPELGLHPEAIGILAELIRTAAARTQVVVATQSPLLLDQFAVEDIIVARRRNGASTFERLEEHDYLDWLEDYSLGELWTRNVIEGGTVHE